LLISTYEGGGISEAGDQEFAIDKAKLIRQNLGVIRDWQLKWESWKMRMRWRIGRFGRLLLHGT
jgi:hypothetical protein